MPVETQGQGFDAVIGVVDRSALDALLSDVHRGGFGHLARVLDPRRGDLDRQLHTAGLRPTSTEMPEDGEAVVVAISAAARCDAARVLLQRAGAQRIETISQGAAGLPALAGMVAGMRPTGGRRPRRR